ncbi:MAG: PAS domain S-box protein, partial [Bacteroidota bacterium]
MKKQNATAGAALRRKAEALLKKHSPIMDLSLSEADNLKLIHELEMMRFELSMQQEESLQAKELADAAANQSAESYEFSPSGHFKLSREGEIISLNLRGAQMLGKERSLFNNNRFGFFISDETKPVFNFFLAKLFISNVRESCEVTLSVNRDHPIHLHLSGILSAYSNECLISAFDITERKHKEEEYEMVSRIVLMINSPGDFRERLSELTSSLQIWSECEAVGIRLRDGDDYPYYETRGFPAAFVEDERSLCAYGPDGKILLDSKGDPLLECMCGNIICGRFDRTKPFFTNGGSFWSNSATALLASTTDADRQARTRNRCHRDGYESVALIPLRSGSQPFGLLQFNDHRPNCFTAALIASFEKMADYISIALLQFQTEQKVKESNDRFTTLADNIPGYLAYINATTLQYEFVNDMFAKLYGIPQEKIIGRPVKEIIGEANSQFILKYISEAKAGKTVSYENTINTESGIRWLHVNYTPVAGPGGQVLSIVVLSYDITNRKLAEEALRISENRFRAIFNEAPLGIALIDSLNGHICEANPMFANIAGRTVAELNNTDWMSITHPDDIQIGMENTALMNTGKISGFQAEKRYLHPDGTSIWINMTLSSIHAEDKAHPQHLSMIEDITDRKRIEDELSISKLRYDKLVSKIPVGVFILHSTPDGSFSFDYVSPKMAAILNQRVESLLADAGLVSQSIHPDDRTSFDSVTRECIRLGRPFNWKGRMLDDGKEKWLNFSSVPEQQEDDNILWHGIITDITERMQAEIEISLKSEELSKVITEKDKFFSIIAHDLRGPLGSLMGLTEAMADPTLSFTAGEQSEMKSELNHSAHNIFSLLENLLEWSKMERGLTLLDFRIINLTKSVNECINAVSESARDKAIKINVDIPGGLKVFADTNILQTVLRNLVSNSIKFTPRGGSISITAVASENDRALIGVKDTGIGMTREMQKDLFKIDVKSGRRGTEGEPSSGLGLVLCKEFVEKQGG